MHARLRQAIGVLVRIIMEQRGWRKTGTKGSLGVRAAEAARTPAHNTGGVGFWFIRAERYRREEGMPYRSVKDRGQEIDSASPRANVKQEEKRQAAPLNNVNSAKRKQGSNGSR